MIYGVEINEKQKSNSLKKRNQTLFFQIIIYLMKKKKKFSIKKIYLVEILQINF